MKRIQAQFAPSIGIVKNIGIDLGTANTLVYLKGKGIVLQEPSVVAIRAHTGEILAVGSEAKEMIGRTANNITAIRPLREGAIADFNTTRSMLKYFISKAVNGRTFFKPRVLIGIPLGVTQVEKRAVVEAALQAGAKEAFLVEEPLAAALGAGLKVSDPKGCMVVDIGGGTTEVAIIAMNDVVIGRSIRMGGDKMNSSIVRYLKRKYNLEIGEGTAEKIKQDIGYATDPPKGKGLMVKGRNLATGLPVRIEVDAEEISLALQEDVNLITEVVQTCIEKAPPELASDIMDRGMILVGGGALLKNIDRHLSKHLSIPVVIAEDPLTCVARGTGLALEELSILRQVATDQRAVSNFR
ncbi:MAG: rod shape-determining protein [Carboxydocellales bacterium]